MSKSSKDAEFFAALGESLGNWQTVEYALAQIFMLSLLPHTERAALVFENITNFRDKLAAVDAVVRAALQSTPQLDLWHKIHKRLRRLSFTRNKIIHAMIVGVQESGDVTLYAVPSSLRKVPPGAFLDANSKRKHFRDTRYLKQTATAFRLATLEVYSFIDSARPTLTQTKA